MRLIGRVVGSLATITVVLVVVFGGLLGLGAPMLLALPIGLGLAVALQYRRSRTMEVGWAGSSGMATRVPVAGAPSAGPTGRRVGRWGVAGSLARVEARELVASPWFHVGIAFWILILVLFGILFYEDIERSWLEFFGLTSLMCHPLAAFTIVAAHRNRTRSRRDGCDEMFDACPADPNSRTLGHLGTAWVAAVAQVAFVLALASVIAIRSSHEYGPLGAYVVAALLACAVLGAGAVALGVTLGRWAPWGIVPFAAVVAVGVATSNINGIGQPSFATDRLLATAVATTGVDPIFIPWRWWERVVWLAAITVMVAALGLLGGRTKRVVAGVLVGAALLALGSAVLIVRPATDDADRIAELVVDPLAGSTCRSAGGDVEVCAYDGYETLTADTVAAVAPVVAAIPDGVLRDVVLMTYFERDLEQLPAEVQDRLAGREVALPEGVLRLRYNVHPENFLAARLRLASLAVGLPTEISEQFPTVQVDGQARGVIVLWLAGQGLSGDERGALLAPGRLDHAADPSASRSVWPGLCHEEAAVLQWSPTDVEAARVLFAMPDAEVGRVIEGRWTELVAPGATTDDLLVAVGAAPLGPPVPIPEQDVTCE